MSLLLLMDLTRSLEWVGEIPVAFALKVQRSKWYSTIMPMRRRKRYVFALNFLNYISFKLYEKTRRILETYQTQPFRHYQKLSTIMDNSRATGRFTHRGTMRPSDIENESDHSASTDNLGNQTSLSKQLPSESLTPSWHGSTSSSGQPPTSLATPHSISESPHLSSLPKPSSSVYPPLSLSPSTFSRSYPFTTTQVYVPPAPDSYLPQRDGQIR
jgi:hypothetical protein